MTEKVVTDQPQLSNIASNYSIMHGAIKRERSFVGNSNPQRLHNRRSLAFNIPTEENKTIQLRGKQTVENYRTSKPKSTNSITAFSVGTQNGSILQTKSSPNIHQQMQYFVNQNPVINRKQTGVASNNVPLKGNLGHRPLSVTHSTPLANNAILAMRSPDNTLNQNTNSSRVKFSMDSQIIYNKNQFNSGRHHSYASQQKKKINETNQNSHNNNPLISGPMQNNPLNINPIQRSKSLSSADALSCGMAGLGLGLSNEVTYIGKFPPEVQSLIDVAVVNPNTLNSRCLMELTSHLIKRAVESRRYALPISRLCLNIIAKEQQETFLEALLNVCRQWYHEREKLLFIIQGLKSPSRIRFTAFMAFLTEMFCQLKRRQFQMDTEPEGTPPSLILLTLLSKCCEDCVKAPIRSISEIECLFYVLTCIGQDMESQLPQQLESILYLVRDAFLNANDSQPTIRRTLLQLIELKASHWQLPGNTVLYYYPAK